MDNSNRCVDSRRFFFRRVLFWSPGFCSPGFVSPGFCSPVLLSPVFVHRFFFTVFLFAGMFSPGVFPPGFFASFVRGVSFVIFVQEGLQLSKWRALKRSVRANNRKTNFPPLKHWILCSEIFVFNYFHQTHRFQAAGISFPSPLFRVLSKP